MAFTKGEHCVIFPGVVVGSLGTSPLNLLGLGHMISLLPEGAVWSVGGIGRC